MRDYLLTGATGFLGGEIHRSLKNDSFTLGRSSLNDIKWDFSSKKTDLPKVKMVIHCAGKAHVVPKSQLEKTEFFNVNFTGTVNLIESLEASKAVPDTFVFISTVAVYGLEEGIEITEDRALMGDSPYAKSKILAEDKLRDWSKERGVNLIILRLPLIAGNYPPGNLGAMIKAIRKGYYFGIRNNSSKKSTVLAQDIASLIPELHGKSGTFNLTDGIHPSISQLEEVLANRLNQSLKIIPVRIVKLIAKSGDLLSFLPLNTSKLKKLTSSLTFDDSKASRELDWKPTSVLDFLKYKLEL